MNNSTLETLAWVLIYGGLLAACLGLFVWLQAQPAAPALGLGLIAGGLVFAVLGAALILVRARRAPEAGEEP